LILENVVSDMMHHHELFWKIAALETHEYIGLQLDNKNNDEKKIKWRE
jgi:hypothetical protein